MTKHELLDPTQVNYPTAGHYMWTVMCSCGRYTSPLAKTPEDAAKPALAHKLIKEALHK